jgi:hypothetical protein
MHKLFVLILISILFITGCSLKEIDTSDINQTVDIIIKNGYSLANINGSGYKYYLPKGVRVIDATNYNEKLYADGNTYYLYIDVISYYYKKGLDYKVNNQAYLSRLITNDIKKGYLEVNKINDNYFIKMMYNYARIETIVDKEDIDKAIANISYILASIRYNDVVIKLLFDKNMLNYSEERFSLFKPTRTEGNFLDYIDEYDNYQAKDEDIISSDQTNTE